MDVDPSLIHRLFYPQVPLVMSAQASGRVSAMPVVSYASVSDSPPMVAVACSPLGFTCKLAVAARAFSLSVLDRGHQGKLSLLATLSGAKLKDKLTEAGLKHTVGRRLDVPVLEDSLATLECRLKSKRKTGDHQLLVAAVESAYASGAFSESWDFARYGPILYTGWVGGMTTYQPNQV